VDHVVIIIGQDLPLGPRKWLVIKILEIVSTMCMGQTVILKLIINPGAVYMEEITSN